jgi:hypothetical protein
MGFDRARASSRQISLFVVYLDDHVAGGRRRNPSDANCPEHILLRYETAEVAAMLAERDKRVETLEAEVDRLRLVRFGW